MTKIEERAKKESSMFEAFYKAKQPSMLNFKIDRMIKFNSKFQLEVYKVNPIKFHTYYSLKEIEAITRKEEPSLSVKVFFIDVSCNYLRGTEEDKTTEILSFR